jgi:hypothetical protein
MYFSTSKLSSSIKKLEGRLGHSLKDLLQSTVKKVLLNIPEVKVTAVIPMHVTGNNTEPHYLVEFMVSDKYTSRKVYFPSDVETLVESILEKEGKSKLIIPD